MITWGHGEAHAGADAMSHALVERYGRWVVGSRWSHDEGDFDGGPVGHWCCPTRGADTPSKGWRAGFTSAQLRKPGARSAITGQAWHVHRTPARDYSYEP